MFRAPSCGSHFSEAAKPVLPNWGLVELIEAAARAGSPERGTAAMRRLSQSCTASGSDWALGVEARSRALLSEDETADRLHREAFTRPDVLAELAKFDVVRYAVPGKEERAFKVDYVPTLVLTDEKGQEVEYYRYDRLIAPANLDDDDFNPDKLWAAPKPASGGRQPPVRGGKQGADAPRSPLPCPVTT